MKKYRVTWIEQNKNGSQTEESIGVKASSPDHAVEQTHIVGNVVEIKKIEQLLF